MKGYWYIVAISVGFSCLTIYYHNYWFMVGFFLWIIYLYYNERLGKLPLIVSTIFFLFFSLYIPSKKIDSNYLNQAPSIPTRITGDIVSSPTITEKKVEFILEDQNLPYKLLILYFPNETTEEFKESYSYLKYGATCELFGKLELPEESRNPGQFDYRDYLFSQGISHQVIVNSLDEISCEGSALISSIFFLRSNLINYISKKINSETAAWLNALILGDDSLISSEITELFQQWSLSHILAISGLHVGLIVGLFYFLLVTLNIVTKEKAQWILIFFLPVYAILAGSQPSVWRASTMVLLIIILNKVKIKFSVTDALSIVFLILIFFDKYLVYHIGFQLSFIVTLGLILSRRLISDTQSKLFRVLQISFISQMMILPLLVNYFSIFQPLSILLNMFVVPYFSLFVIPYMFFLLVILPAPSLIINLTNKFFLQIHGFFLEIIQHVDDFVDYKFVLGDFPILVTIIYYGLFFMMMKNLQNKKLKESFRYGFLIVFIIFCLSLKPYVSPKGTVTMLDIGQGDAFVIELPYRKGVFMIDAGAHISFTDFNPTEKVYQQIIKPYLYSRGIQELDAIFLSHKDIDHMGSVEYIVNDFNVDQILISQYYELDQEELQFYNKQGIQVKRLQANQKVQFKAQQFAALSPLEDTLSENDNSLVLYSEIGGKSWLFTGDISKEIENKIGTRFKHLSVDVLKVAHHGSNTSTDRAFLSMIKPTYALIPVGLNNSYGHPTTEVIQTLESQNLKIFRTDYDGAVQYHFKNDSGTFQKYLP